MDMPSKTTENPESGDNLVNLLVAPDRAEVLKELSLHLSSITLNDHQLCDIELLATGAFSPLDGFLNRPDYEAVLDRMQLQDGTVWPLPICLSVSEKQGAQLEGGQSVAVRDPEGFLLAILHIEEIWPIEKDREALAGLKHQTSCTRASTSRCMWPHPSRSAKNATARECTPRPRQA